MDFGSEEMEQMLKRAGWSENRLVDTREYERHLNKMGYSVFPNAMHFFQQFAYLQLPRKATDADGSRYRLLVDPLLLTEYHSRQDIAEFEEAIGRALCPIALALNGTAAIVIDQQGIIYCIEELVLFHVANTIPEAIRILCVTNLGEMTIVLELD